MSDSDFLALRLRLVRNELTEDDRLLLAECMRQVEERLKLKREERAEETASPF